MGAYENKSAEKGKIFVLTESGYEKSPERVRNERKIGKPLKGYEYRVPISWIKKGYVEEIEEGGQIESD